MRARFISPSSRRTYNRQSMCRRGNPGTFPIHSPSLAEEEIATLTGLLRNRRRSPRTAQEKPWFQLLDCAPGKRSNLVRSRAMKPTPKHQRHDRAGRRRRGRRSVSENYGPSAKRALATSIERDPATPSA